MKDALRHLLRGASFLFDLSGSRSAEIARRCGSLGRSGLHADAMRLNADAQLLNGDMRAAFGKRMSTSSSATAMRMPLS